MKVIFKISKIVPILFLAFGFYACSDDDDNGGGGDPPVDLTIVETAIATENLSSLVAALQQADLVTTLNGGPFTVLAPTNAAFEAFLTANGFDSLADVPNDVLTQVLLNHVINGEILSTDLVAAGAGYASTNAVGAGGNDMSIYFSTGGDVTFNGVSNVSTADVSASNGVIHIVDAVIGLPSVVDHAAANSDFSSLVAALGAADGNLVNVLSGAGPFTILAPNNSAFTTFLDGTPLDNVDPAILSQILLNHVLGGVTLASDLSASGSGYTNTSATGAGDNPMSLYFNVDGNVTFNGISNVTNADIVGTNGVIHAVDAVIGLPTIVDFALANPNLSSLVAALTSADSQDPSPNLIPTLASPGTFTVFAPTNTAFEDLLIELDPTGNTTLGDIDPAVVEAVLGMHVVGANVTSSELMSGTIMTLNENITADATNFTLTDPNGRVSNIITTLVDIQASNGVVHAIDKVILPLQ